MMMMTMMLMLFLLRGSDGCDVIDGHDDYYSYS